MAESHTIDVDFQPNITVKAKPTQELTLYCPLHIVREYDESEYEFDEEVLDEPEVIPSNSEKTSDNTTIIVNSEKPSNSTTTSKNTTTTTKSTTPSNNKGENPDTGDSFPVLPITITLI